MTTFENALETAMELQPSELDDFISILSKRRSQNWRRDTSEYYHSIKDELNEGNLNPLIVEDALDELHSYVNSDK